MNDRTLLSTKECKKRLLDILVAIDDICKRNNIKYQLAYGTLLGAVRHKGFIPWDDDIDIVLMRKDYEKLIGILRSQNVYSWLKLIDYQCDGYFYPFAKAVDNRTIARMEDNTTEHGLWIDIFPLDNVPDSEVECQGYLKRCKFLRALTIAMTTDFTNVKTKFSFKFITKLLLNGLAVCIGRYKIADYMIRCMQKYKSKNTENVCVLFSIYIMREKMRREDLIDTIYTEFEGYSFPIPANYDMYLSKMYGNYMQLPPIEKRRTHSITAWEIKNS
ncbi:MAG: LicD family protein [Bacteroidaceae bacterium]|nr:LicD family protein [Bacteroidaceae bacterium]